MNDADIPDADRSRMSPPPNSPAFFSLSLANGHAWQFNSDGDCERWLAKFASILKLERTPRSAFPLIFMVEAGARDGPLHAIGKNPGMPTLPRTGWNIRAFGAFRYLSHPAVQHRIVELAPQWRDDDNMAIMQMAGILFCLGCDLLDAGAIFLHAALLEFNSGGVMIAGPGDSGKSTCARRIEPPWRAHGDDLGLVFPDRSGSYFALPCPTWSDYYFDRDDPPLWDIHARLPLEAILFLKQSEQDEVVPIGRAQAATGIFYSSMQIVEPFLKFFSPAETSRIRSQIFSNSCHIAEQVPSFILNATKNGRFWEKIEDQVHEPNSRDGARIA
jgi:SynChlorMet cassette protein ScmC